MNQRLQFPLFNAFLCAIMGVFIGYYLRRPVGGLLIGALSGALLAAAAEAALGRLGPASWVYRRRALFLVLVEIPFGIFIAGPYALVAIDIQPDHHAVCCQTPLDYGAPGYENIRIETPDGITLVGWYVPPRESPGPVIILLPGAGSDRRGTSWHARQLIAAGYGAMLYDPRGIGESTGDHKALGWQDRADPLAAALNLQGRPEVDGERIGVVGLSRGAHVAINAAYLQPGCFGALWLDGMGPQQMRDEPAPRSGGEKFIYSLDAATLKMAELELGMAVPPAIGQMLSEMDRPPMTIVASGLDDFERRTNENYVKLHRESQTTWLIENAGHVGGPGLVPDEYSRRMLAFFEDALRKPAGRCSLAGPEE